MSDYYDACRTSAAGTCSVPDQDITAPSDQCVCATLSGYDSKFLNCISTTDGGVYASCLASGKYCLTPFYRLWN